MNRRRVSITGAALLAAVALAACSGDPAPGKSIRAARSTGSTTTTVDHAHMQHGDGEDTVTTTVPSATSGTTPATAPTTAALPTGASSPSPPPTTTGSTVPATTPPTTVKPYDPNAPIDLSGTPGVSPAQETAAEALLRATLQHLPRYATTAAAYAAGYRSIGDALTGDEHWVNWSYLDDGRLFDARYPESLVYRVPRSGYPKLEAAMYMLPTGSTFADIPPLFRSPLTQFHVHRDICFARTADPLQLVVAGFASGAGGCPPGTTDDGNVPMLHAWIVPNRCGPFAALEGLGAGQVPDGETHTCDTLHASRGEMLGTAI